MEIVNRSDKNVSWFCYNSNDVAKWIALASGDLSSNGGSKSYDPPDNATSLYFVRFTEQGGGNELAGGTTKKSAQAITLLGTNGQYHSEVKNV